MQSGNDEQQTCCGWCCQFSMNAGFTLSIYPTSIRNFRITVLYLGAEKSLVMDMIRAAVAGREEYWKQYPAEVIEQNDAQNKLPPINGATKPSSSHEVNR